MSAISIGVWPVAPGARLVLLFGGTFDPPHVAHVELPALVRERVRADAVVYILAARSPHKPGGPEASGDDRVEMLGLALEQVDHVSISTIELERDDDQPSYTIDTVRQIRTLAGPDVTLRWLIGADQAAAFHRWRSPDELIRLAEPLVMLRAPHESADRLLDAMRPHWTPEELERWRTRVIAVPVRHAEATEVRRLLATDPDEPALARLVPDAVLGFIRKRGLYR